VKTVRAAWRAGRSVVPIVGAGLSAESGVPILNAVVRYLARFHQFLAHRAFLPAGGGAPARLTEWVAGCQRRPWEYVAAMDWPEVCDLNQDLLLRLEADGTGPVPDRHRRAVYAAFDAVLGQVNPDGRRTLEGLRDRLLAAPGDPADPARAALDAHVRAAFGPQDGRHLAWDLIGDWKRMIQFFTNYQGDYADALFVKLTAGRAPNPGHRFLAFLVKLLSIKTVLTFNFDEFIEQALQSEGVTPRVFAMEEGRGIPHHSLVRDAVSVVKLHGTNHALLLDERVDHPLTDDYKRRFAHLVGTDPLLLVVGCSGGDFRLRDLVGHVLHWEPDAKAPPPANYDPRRARVVWLHFEREPPPFIAQFRADHPALAGRLLAAPTNQPGSALQHLYAALTGRHPASPLLYPAHVEKPVPLPLAPDPPPPGPPAAAGPAPPGVEEHLTAGPFVVCLPPAGRAPAPFRSSSETLLELADVGTRWGYHVIWVDLESVHTPAAVVGTLIDQCRRYDPTLAPSVLPLDETPGVLDRARDRVRHALRRAQYLVLLDGLETYTWPPTSHHGDAGAGREHRAARLAYLVGLLAALAERGGIGNSVVVLGVDEPRERTARAAADNDALREAMNAHLGRLRAAGWRVPGDLPDGPRLAPSTTDEAARLLFLRPGPGGEWLTTLTPQARADLGLAGDPAADRDRWALVLHTLCSFRRPRPLPAVRHLLGPFLGGRDRVDAALTALTRRPGRLGVLRLEGGVVWLNRPMRDWVYAANARFAEREELVPCLDRPDQAPNFELVAGQVFLLATLHQRISRMYYTRTFVQSHDTSAFLEHVYHRVSSIRSLAKLIALARANGPRTAAALGRCGGMIRRALADGAQADEIRRRMEMGRGDPLDAAVFGTGPAPDPGALAAELEDRHLRQVYSLNRAWVRAETALRAQQPAEQLIHWCDVLLTEDLPHRFNRVTRPGGAADDYVPTAGGGPDVNPRAAAAVAGFRRTVNNFRVKLQVERSDYARALADRLGADLAPFAAAGTGGDFPPDPDRLARAAWPVPTLSQVHHLLDASLCYIKRGQEDERPDLVLAAAGLNRFIGTTLTAYAQPIERLTAACARASVRDLPAALAEARRGLPSAAAAALDVLEACRFDDLAGGATDYQEACLRLGNMEAEVALGGASVFADGFRGDAIREPLTGGRAAALAAADRGLMLARHQDSRVSGPLRSVVLEPTPDGSLYLQYRSNFHILRGRVVWLEAFGPDGKVREPGAVEEAFEGAYRHFDLARGGLGGTNRVLGALTELYTAEACLAYARVLLFPGFRPDALVPAGAAAAAPGADRPPPPPGLLNCLAEAQAKYESARFALLRARDGLLAGRRNVIWWKLFLMLVAQYQSDRLLHAGCLLVAVGYDPDHPAVPPAGLLARLRRGYTAVRGALDYQLPGRRTPSSRWLNRVWTELTLAAAGAGYCLAAGLKEKAGVSVEYILSLVGHLNRSAGLDDQWWSEFQKAAYNLLPRGEVVDPLRLRVELLRRADEWAAGRPGGAAAAAGS
jgi:hypothetical protein